MTSEEAKAYGIIDDILIRQKNNNKKK